MYTYIPLALTCSTVPKQPRRSRGTLIFALQFVTELKVGFGDTANTSGCNQLRHSPWFCQPWEAALCLLGALQTRTEPPAHAGIQCTWATTEHQHIGIRIINTGGGDSASTEICGPDEDQMFCLF